MRIPGERHGSWRGPAGIRVYLQLAAHPSLPLSRYEGGDSGATEPPDARNTGVWRKPPRGPERHPVRPARQQQQHKQGNR